MILCSITYVTYDLDRMLRIITLVYISMIGYILYSGIFYHKGWLYFDDTVIRRVVKSRFGGVYDSRSIIVSNYSFA